MAKITVSDLKSLGFTREMFVPIAADDTAFDDLLTTIIAEQALQLSGRIGTTAYNDAASPNADYVKMAEKYLSAAELIQRRINVLLGNSVSAGQELATANERNQRKDYLAQADGWIAKVVAGSTIDSADFASGALVTSHFEETT